VGVSDAKLRLRYFAHVVRGGLILVVLECEKCYLLGRGCVL
jgi:hypothetical protein